MRGGTRNIKVSRPIKLATIAHDLELECLLTWLIMSLLPWLPIVKAVLFWDLWVTKEERGRDQGFSTLECCKVCSESI